VTADRRTALEAMGIAEVALVQVDVRVDPASSRGPSEPNTWTADAEREWLWLGPDEWLVVGEHGDLVRQLDDALTGTHHSVVDVSASRIVFELRGAGRFDLLEQGCGLDLHPRSWRPGRCAQTLLARVPVILQERQEATRVFVRTSFAGHLVDWLRAVRPA
jgi:sarcosine oxidase subunit gamma